MNLLLGIRLIYLLKLLLGSRLVCFLNWFGNDSTHRRYLNIIKLNESQ
jgi:hypothetical protein